MMGMGLGIVGGALEGAGQGAVDVAKPWVQADAQNWLQQQQSAALQAREQALENLRTQNNIKERQAGIDQDIAAAPVKGKIANDTTIDLKDREAKIAPSAKDQADIDLKGAQARYYDGARTTQAMAAADAARDKGGRAARAELDKQAQTAAADIRSTMLADKDETGATRWTAQDIARRADLAAQLVQRGMSGAQAQALAMQAPIRGSKEIDAQLAAEEAKLPRVGMMDSGKSGDVKLPNGQTMPIEQWRAARRQQVSGESPEFTKWMADNGLGGGRAAAAPGGGGAPSYPDGTELRGPDGRIYVAQGGKPVLKQDQPQTASAPAAAQPWDDSGRIKAPSDTPAPAAAPAKAGKGIVGKNVDAPQADTSKVDWNAIPEPPQGGSPEAFNAWEAKYGDLWREKQEQIKRLTASGIRAQGEQTEKRYESTSLKAKLRARQAAGQQ